MTYKQIQKQITKIADEINAYLGELESEGKDTTKNYEALLYIAGGLEELADKEFSD